MKRFALALFYIFALPALCLGQTISTSPTSIGYSNADALSTLVSAKWEVVKCNALSADLQTCVTPDTTVLMTATIPIAQVQQLATPDADGNIFKIALSIPQIAPGYGALPGSIPLTAFISMTNSVLTGARSAASNPFCRVSCSPSTATNLKTK